MRVVLLTLLLWFPLPALCVCSFPSAPKVLLSVGPPQDAGSKLLLQWDLQDAAVYWSTEVPASASLAKFKRELAQKVPDLSVLSLLRRAIAVLPAGSADLANAKLTLQEAKRWLEPTRCFESVLLGFQTDRRDMLTAPTEFLAFVLRSRSKPKLRIFSYTVNQPGIGGFGEIAKRVKGALASDPDWTLWMNLHNHNFFLQQPPLSGIPAPSAADVGAFRGLAEDYGLAEAWITNGFDSLHLPREDFARFSGR